MTRSCTVMTTLERALHQPSPTNTCMVQILNNDEQATAAEATGKYAVVSPLALLLRSARVDPGGNVKAKSSVRDLDRRIVRAQGAAKGFHGSRGPFPRLCQWLDTGATAAVLADYGMSVELFRDGQAAAMVAGLLRGRVTAFAGVSSIAMPLSCICCTVTRHKYTNDDLHAHGVCWVSH